MEPEAYNQYFRNYVKAKLDNAKEKYGHDCIPQHSKEQPLKAQQNVHENKVNMQSGGDADRVFYKRMRYYKHRNSSANNCGLNQLHCNPKALASTVCDTCCSSEGSQKTSKTVVSRKSSDDLRKNVRSQCKLHEDIEKIVHQIRTTEIGANADDNPCRFKSSDDLRKSVQSQCKLHEDIAKTLNKISTTEIGANADDNPCRLNEQTTTQCSLILSQCKRCRDGDHSIHSQKDVMTDIGKSDFLECRNTDTLTLSVNDIVDSKVVNPIIRKMQRMFLNNLKEEMSVMEDLERLPHKVNEVYKATHFKQKD